MIASNRQEDKRLFSQYVVKGWSGVKECTGEVVPYSKENVSEFLEALPSWIFDELRVFCTTPGNFLEEGVSEAEETGKASGSGSSLS